MLDLEVQPERSLGNEQWEFILGELSTGTNNVVISFCWQQMNLRKQQIPVLWSNWDFWCSRIKIWPWMSCCATGSNWFNLKRLISGVKVESNHQLISSLLRKSRKLFMESLRVCIDPEKKMVRSYCVQCLSCGSCPCKTRTEIPITGSKLTFALAPATKWTSGASSWSACVGGAYRFVLSFANHVVCVWGKGRPDAWT